MLVLSRVRGESIVVSGPAGGCLVTVMLVGGTEATVLVSLGTVHGEFDAWTRVMRRDETVKVGVEGAIAKVTVVDIRGEKVRLGIEASKGEGSMVYRLEVWEQIRQLNRRGMMRRGRMGLGW